MRKILLLLLLFPPSIFAIFIHCHFTNKIEVLDGKSFYGCNIVQSKIFHCPTHLTGFEGSHLDGKDDDDVLAVECGFGCFQLDRIPQSILDFFPNLIALMLRHTKIKFLDGFELVGYQRKFLEIF